MYMGYLLSIVKIKKETERETVREKERETVYEKERERVYEKERERKR